jgi:hypothetical protein
MINQTEVVVSSKSTPDRNSHYLFFEYSEPALIPVLIPPPEHEIGEGVLIGSLLSWVSEDKHSLVLPDFKSR